MLLFLDIDLNNYKTKCENKSSRGILSYQLLNNWFMLQRALSSYGARGKFGEHERRVRVARGDSRGQL